MIFNWKDLQEVIWSFHRQFSNNNRLKFFNVLYKHVFDILQYYCDDEYIDMQTI